MNKRQDILDGSTVRKESGVLSAQPMVSVTLTREQYQRLEQGFPARLTDQPTLAAIQLGQQMVLKALRDGFVA